MFVGIGAGSPLVHGLAYVDLHNRGHIRFTDAEQINVDDLPTLKKWEDRMWAREAVQKGANVPEPYKMKELLADKEAMEKHAAQVSQLLINAK